MSDQQVFPSDASPIDVASWLRLQGWRLTGALGEVAQRWRSSEITVVVPTTPSAPDFALRWTELFEHLARAFDTDPGGVLLAITKSGSDIAEFRAVGHVDDSMPLGDAATLIESVRRALQASANSALQPRSYYGHSVPDVAREHATKARMGQTRRGSYVIPIISRLPILRAAEDADAVLFDDSVYQPFARTAMMKLAEGLEALRALTHGPSQATRSAMNEAVGAGVSSDLCDAVADTLECDSITDLGVTFNWAERLPAARAPRVVSLDAGAVWEVRRVGEYLKGDQIVGRQTVVGYVKRLDRGEDDEFGRVTVRAIDGDRARNVTMELSDADYHIAGEANTDRRIVSATGVLHRESGRALRLTSVDDFRLQEAMSLFESEGERS
ncbi:hypothetical protein [Microbacterium paludicola]|uniref:hypothetical protein n=1 Tax=Microbacterium paludicola TaxID=300019 RepID=UPI000B32B6EB|nr:hypothetical protein [Microbacterium paludicola]